MSQPDPKPPARVRDHMLLRRLHLTWKECAIGAEYEHEGCDWRRSLHHIHRHPRDDVQANLIMLCGSGTTGCHGRVEARDPDALEALGAVIVMRRADTLDYLIAKLGSWEAAGAWINRYLFAPSLKA